MIFIFEIMTVPTTVLRWSLPYLPRFSDLDVRDLIDLETGRLLCKHCDMELVEDEVGNTHIEYHYVLEVRDTASGADGLAWCHEPL